MTGFLNDILKIVLTVGRHDPPHILDCPTRPGNTHHRGAMINLQNVAVVYLSCFFSAKSVLATIPFGIQSWDGLQSSFGSDMVFDNSMSRMYITGGTSSNYFDESSSNSSSCFLGVLDLEPDGSTARPKWIRRSQIGSSSENQACSGVATMRDFNGRRTILVGHSTSNDSFPIEIFTNAAEADRSVHGFVMDLTWQGGVRGSYLLENEVVEYPIAVELENDRLLVTSLQSSSDTENEAFMSWERVHPGELDPTTAGGYLPPKYGSNFTVGIQKLRPVQQIVDETDTLEEADPEAFRQKWWRKLRTSEGSSLQVSSSLLISDDRLIIAGSTMGTGDDLGSQIIDGSLDGFIVSIHPNEGVTLASERVASERGGMDRILGLCGTRNSDSFYAVGMTDGVLAGSNTNLSATTPGQHYAFLIKLDAVTLSTDWVYQLGGLHTLEGAQTPAQVHGLSCAVTLQNDRVYLAGNVLDGAAISIDGENPLIDETPGKGDVFVVQLDTSNGRVNYAHQFGSDEDDTLANGRSIACDDDGDAILLGNTRGDFFGDGQERQQKGISSSMFVMSLQKKTGKSVFSGPLLNHLFSNSPSLSPSGSPSVAETDVPSSIPPFKPSSNTAVTSPPSVPLYLSPTMSPTSPEESTAPSIVYANRRESTEPTIAYIARNESDTANDQPDYDEKSHALIIAAIVLAILVAVSMLIVLILRLRSRWDRPIYLSYSVENSANPNSKIYMEDPESTENASQTSGDTLFNKYAFLEFDEDKARLLRINHVDSESVLSDRSTQPTRFAKGSDSFNSSIRDIATRRMYKAPSRATNCKTSRHSKSTDLLPSSITVKTASNRREI